MDRGVGRGERVDSRRALRLTAGSAKSGHLRRRPSFCKARRTVWAASGSSMCSRWMVEAKCWTPRELWSNCSQGQVIFSVRRMHARRDALRECGRRRRCCRMRSQAAPMPRETRIPSNIRLGHGQLSATPFCILSWRCGWPRLPMTVRASVVGAPISPAVGQLRFCSLNIDTHPRPPFRTNPSRPPLTLLVQHASQCFSSGLRD